jgi:hypothetical protein
MWHSPRAYSAWCRSYPSVLYGNLGHGSDGVVSLARTFNRANAHIALSCGSDLFEADRVAWPFRTAHQCAQRVRQHTSGHISTSSLATVADVPSNSNPEDEAAFMAILGCSATRNSAEISDRVTAWPPARPLRTAATASFGPGHSGFTRVSPTAASMRGSLARADS